MNAAHAVLNIQSHHVKAPKSAPDIRMVVDTHHYLTLAATHDAGHLLVLLKAKINPITFRLPVRWIEVEKRVRPVIALHACLPSLVFDCCSSHPQVSRA